MKHTVRTLLWASVLSLAPAAALAQTDPAATDVHAHFDRGVRLMNEHRYGDALAEFELVRQAHPTAALYYDLGLVQRLMGQDLEAIASFRECLERLAPDTRATRRREIEGYVQELLARVGHLALRIEPADARVRVDDRALAQGARAVEVDPGHHVVVAEADGFAAERRELDVPSGGAATVAMTLPRAPVAPSAPAPRAVVPSARLHVSTDAPQAGIRIDGRDVGAGSADQSLPAGRHTVEAWVEGRGVVFHRDVDLAAATVTRLRVHVATERSIATSPWLWAGVGAAVVVAATVVVVALQPRGPFVGTWGSAEALTLRGAP